MRPKYKMSLFEIKRKREMRLKWVYDLKREGLSSKEIGSMLGVSSHRVNQLYLQARHLRGLYLTSWSTFEIPKGVRL